MSISAIFLLLTACKQSPPEDKIVVVTGGGHSAASTEDHAQYSFPCCDQAAITDVIAAYIDLADALAGDNEAGAKAAGVALAAQATQASQSDTLNETDRGRANRIAALASPWASEDITAIRADLTDLAAEALPMAKEHRGGDRLTAVVAFCPMAPGRWLQSKPELRNPYFGAQMLSCGVFEQ